MRYFEFWNYTSPHDTSPIEREREREMESFDIHKSMKKWQMESTWNEDQHKDVSKLGRVVCANGSPESVGGGARALDRSGLK